MLGIFFSLRFLQNHEILSLYSSWTWKKIIQFQPGLDYNIVNDSSLKYTEVDADKFPFKNICLLFLFFIKNSNRFCETHILYWRFVYTCTTVCNLSTVKLEFPLVCRFFSLFLRKWRLTIFCIVFALKLHQRVSQRNWGFLARWQNCYMLHIFLSCPSSIKYLTFS